MEEIGASFLVTGEVVGQRPMSQRDDALRGIEKHSGCAGIILRPLSARHLPPTPPERGGWGGRGAFTSSRSSSPFDTVRIGIPIPTATSCAAERHPFPFPGPLWEQVQNGEVKWIA